MDLKHPLDAETHENISLFNRIDTTKTLCQTKKVYLQLSAPKENSTRIGRIVN